MIQHLPSCLSKPLSKISFWHATRALAVICAIAALVGMILAFVQYQCSLGLFFALLALVEYVHWNYLGKDRILHKALETHQTALKEELFSFKTENQTLQNQTRVLDEHLNQAKAHAHQLEELTFHYKDQNATLFSQTKALSQIKDSLSKRISKMDRIKNNLHYSCRQLICQRVHLRKIVYMLKTQTTRFTRSNMRLEKIVKHLFRWGKHLAQ